MHELSLNELPLLPVPALPCSAWRLQYVYFPRHGGGRVFGTFAEVACKWGKLRHGVVR